MTDSLAVVRVDDPTTDPQDPRQSFKEVLTAAASGDEQARARLWAEHYEELYVLVVGWCLPGRSRRGAGAHVSIGPKHIVDELYLHLGSRSCAFAHGHGYMCKSLYSECARIMIDHLRRTSRNQGGWSDGPGPLLDLGGPDARLDVLGEVLRDLSRHNRMIADVAALKVLESVRDNRHPGEMRSLRNHEIAKQLGCGLRTVEKHWDFAKGILFARLSER